jgi:hypothetical protein
MNAVCSVVDELIEAVQGIRLFPFMLNAQRVEALTPGAKRSMTSTTLSVTRSASRRPVSSPGG